MNSKQLKYLLTNLLWTISFCAAAQEAANDSTKQQKLPVQAFAAMPILMGLSAENAFSHEKNYQNTDQEALNLKMKNSQVYSIYGSLPIVKQTKGFSAKANFEYNLFNDHIGTSLLNDSLIANNTGTLGSSISIGLMVSQQILFRQSNKKLTLSASYNISGRSINSFDPQTQRGILSATFPLKMSKDNMLLIGIVGRVGKNAGIPVLPIVVYFTRLSSHLNVELFVPIFAQLRYVVSPRTAFLLGAKIGTRTPFMGMETPILQSPDDALVINSQNLRYYLTAEKALNKYLWLYAEAGYNQSLKENLNTSYINLPNQVFTADKYGYPYAKVGVFVRPVFGTIKPKSKDKN